MGLAGALARRAAAAPDRTAVVAGEAGLTWLALDTRARALAADPALAGAGPGGRCLVLLPAAADVLTALAACDRLGATAVIGDPGWPAAVRAAVTGAVEPRHVLDRVPDAVLDRRPGGTVGPPVAGDARTPWLATCTSGSTATPRAVLRTRASWAVSYAPFTTMSGAGPGRTVLVPGPLSGSLFLYGAVHALVASGRLLLDPVGTARPWDVAHLVPPQLAALLGTDHDLAGRTVVVAGAAVRAEVVREARARGLEVLAYYGATELSFVAMGHAGAPLRPFPWVEVEVRDGVLWARSPYVAVGYLDGRPGGPPGAWRTDAQGWATVGDGGSVDESGGVTVGGRGDQVVRTGGATVPVGPVEDALLGLPGIRAAVVVGTPHPELGEVVTAVLVAELGAEVGSGPGSGVGAWRARLAAVLPATHLPRRWYAVRALPVTATGKPARAAVRDGLADGSLGARRLP
ncbi:MAG TPA: class I adenylate-forming enzyme family protein [Jiangellales bacterium]|nr:class I adenylate-forming enzyme family protein [Jiangellales bacterium]